MSGLDTGWLVVAILVVGSLGIGSYHPPFPSWLCSALAILSLFYRTIVCVSIHAASAEWILA